MNQLVISGSLGDAGLVARGLDLARAHVGVGGEAVVEITGLRNPCRQLDSLQSGLMAATLDRDVDGNLIRKAGIKVQQ